MLGKSPTAAWKEDQNEGNSTQFPENCGKAILGRWAKEVEAVVAVGGGVQELLPGKIAVSSFFWAFKDRTYFLSFPIREGYGQVFVNSS